MLRTWRRYTAVPCLAAAAACGGDGSTDPNEPGPMTARIDGDRFVAIQTTVLESGGITAVNGGSADLRAIGFQIQNLSTGTFTIAPGNLVSAGVTIGNAAWGAGGNMGSGTITISILTANRVAGTFQLTVDAISGGASGTLTVTDGVFDIDF